MSQPVVLKFGGTSVGDADAFERVAGVVRAHGGASPVVVVSAMSKVTDALLGAAADAQSKKMPRANRTIAEIFRRHEDVARQLLSHEAATMFGVTIGAARVELARLLKKIAKAPAKTRPAVLDGIAAWGERLSASLLTAVLSARGLRAMYVDGRDCIVTDGAHGRAAPLYKEANARTKAELGPLISKKQVPVLGGFIGRTAKGATTTLGRGGGDFSAAIVGAALGAAEIQIWTDVHGVLTADPRIVTHARTIPRLSYAEAAELAYFGAKVLHPSTIQPALERKIPVRICDSRAPDGPGTLVTAEADIWPETVKAIAHKRGVTIVQVTSARMLGAYGFLKALFDVFDRHQVAVDVVTTSEVSVSLSVDDAARLPAVLKDLRALGEVKVEPNRGIICVVGEGLRKTSGVAGRIFQTLTDINVLLISQGASQVNITFVVDESQVADAVVKLHAALLEKDGPAAAPVARPAARARAGTTPDVGELTRRLIDIPSVSGDEAEIVRFLAEYLSGLGMQVELADAAPGRPNVLATGGAAPRVVLCTHVDTVPPFIGSKQEGGTIWGRGACDAKGILAAQVTAAARLRASGVAEVGLLLVVDEEMGSLGARAANAHARARECRYLIVGEPTDNKLAVGCKGSLRVSLRTTGTGGHSAYPEHGKSAIHTMLEILDDVRDVAWPRDEFYGETTCNVGVMTGGKFTNVLAPDARADLHIRLIGDAQPVKHLLEKAVHGRSEIEYLSLTPVQRLTPVDGFESCVVGFTTDAANLDRWGTPLVLGPGSILVAHTADERIAAAELERGVDLYVKLVRSLLANANAPERNVPMTSAKGVVAR